MDGSDWVRLQRGKALVKGTSNCILGTSSEDLLLKRTVAPEVRFNGKVIKESCCEPMYALQFDTSPSNRSLTANRFSVSSPELLEKINQLKRIIPTSTYVSKDISELTLVIFGSGPIRVELNDGSIVDRDDTFASPVQYGTTRVYGENIYFIGFVPSTESGYLSTVSNIKFTPSKLTKLENLIFQFVSVQGLTFPVPLPSLKLLLVFFCYGVSSLDVSNLPALGRPYQYPVEIFPTGLYCYSELSQEAANAIVAQLVVNGVVGGNLAIREQIMGINLCNPEDSNWNTLFGALGWNNVDSIESCSA
jgi:hypothetical protein